MSNNPGFLPKNGQVPTYNHQNDPKNTTSEPRGTPRPSSFLPSSNGANADATLRLNACPMSPSPTSERRSTGTELGQMGPPPPQTPPLRLEEKKTGLFKNKWLALLGACVSGVVILALVIVAVRGLTGGQTDVTLYQVNSKNVNQDIGGGGITFPLQQINISYPVSEQVLKLSVQTGDSVKVGQSLLQLDPTQLNIQVKQAADNKAAAQAYLNSVSVAGNSVAIAAAQKQYDDATSQYNALVAQSSSPLLHNGNIIAPMAGVITALNINAGEVFSANTPLITIMDESSVIVHVKVPLTNLQQVHLGQSATVTPSAIPNLDLSGTVVSIVPVADPQTDTFEAWVQVKNTNRVLLPGMSAFVRIQSANGKAIAVPRMAVLNPSLDSVVFVVRNSHAYLQPVHIFGRSAETMYVDQGLSQGETVVVTGIQKLKNGQSVHVLNVERV